MWEVERLVTAAVMTTSGESPGCVGQALAALPCAAATLYCSDFSEHGWARLRCPGLILPAHLRAVPGQKDCSQKDCFRACIGALFPPQPVLCRSRNLP